MQHPRKEQVTAATRRYSVAGVDTGASVKSRPRRPAATTALSRKRGREAESDRPLPSGEGPIGGGYLFPTLRRLLVLLSPSAPHPRPPFPDRPVANLGFVSSPFAFRRGLSLASGA